MDDLPVLPFDKILSYLSLEDLIRSRAVSRRWRKMIDSFKVRILFYSDRPAEQILGRPRLVSGAFAQNIICSPRFEAFESFVNGFTNSILSSLKALRLCGLKVGEKNLPAFSQALNSFGRLEEFGLFRFDLHGDSDQQANSVWQGDSDSEGDSEPEIHLELHLPMLNSIQLENVHGIGKLTLDAPRLQKVRIWKCYGSLVLELVHPESVEKLFTEYRKRIEVEQLKNLRYFYTEACSVVDYALLSSLEQLEEVHLKVDDSVLSIFDQKRRYGRADLKIFYCGLLLNGPTDPAIHSRYYPFDEILSYMAENPSGLAYEIPFYGCLNYSPFEDIAPGLTTNVLNRFTGLTALSVDKPVREIEHFCTFLMNSNNIAELCFDVDQPQKLFDHLPEHCSVQKLDIHNEDLDLGFLFRLKNLISLFICDCSIDLETIRKVLEELELLLEFQFSFLKQYVRITRRKRYKVRFSPLFGSWVIVSDLNEAIKFIESEAKADD